jgi:hypothetical protein
LVQTSFTTEHINFTNLTKHLIVWHLISQQEETKFVKTQ